jgi:hypothetical protein
MMEYFAHAHPPPTGGKSRSPSFIDGDGNDVERRTVMSFTGSWIGRAGAVALFAAGGLCFAGEGGQALVQERVPPRPDRDCGPVIVGAGFLALNVGNSNRPPLAPAKFLLRIVDSEGDPLAERTVEVGPGQSRSLRLRLDPPGVRLIRGEIIQIDGPGAYAVVGTMQMQNDGSLTWETPTLCVPNTVIRPPNAN